MATLICCLRPRPPDTSVLAPEDAPEESADEDEKKDDGGDVAVGDVALTPRVPSDVSRASLFSAVEEDDVAAVAGLLDAGVDPNHADGNRQTALFYAALRDAPRTCALLCASTSWLRASARVCEHARAAAMGTRVACRA